MRLGAGLRMEWLFGSIFDARLSRRRRRKLRRMLRKAARVALHLSLLGLVLFSMSAFPLETGMLLLALIFLSLLNREPE